MLVTMLYDRSASPDAFIVKRYLANITYDLPTSLAIELIKIGVAKIAPPIEICNKNKAAETNIAEDMVNLKLRCEYGIYLANKKNQLMSFESWLHEVYQKEGGKKQ